METHPPSYSTSSLTPIQLHLLKMFSYTKQQDTLEELKSVLLRFYMERIDSLTDALWDEKALGAADMEEWLLTHQRTPYR
jgi:hypothetical protein